MRIRDPSQAVQAEVTWGNFRGRVEFLRRRRLPPLRLVTSVHAFIRDGDSLILCRVTRGGSSVWDIPGGHREPGELPIAALRRECLEEAGAMIGNISLLGVIKVTGEGSVPPANIPSAGIAELVL